MFLDLLGFDDVVDELWDKGERYFENDCVDHWVDFYF